MVDKLIVQLQDMARVLRNSPDEVVQIELLEARKCINDADKVKQVHQKNIRKCTAIACLTITCLILRELEHSSSHKMYIVWVNLCVLQSNRMFVYSQLFDVA